jgi:RNA-directed DNA polymerase
MLEISAVLSSGISGGPILNDLHQVIGIAHKGGSSEPRQLAIDVSELLKL